MLHHMWLLGSSGSHVVFLQLKKNIVYEWVCMPLWESISVCTRCRMRNSVLCVWNEWGHCCSSLECTFNSVKLQIDVEHEQRTLRVQSLLWVLQQRVSVLPDTVLPFPPAGSGHQNKQYSYGQLGFVLESRRWFIAKRKRKKKAFAQKEINVWGTWAVGE